MTYIHQLVKSQINYYYFLNSLIIFIYICVNDYTFSFDTTFEKVM